MEKVRGFEIAKGFEDKGINLPVRKTKNSAGYDIEAAEDTIVPVFKPGQKPTLVKTGFVPRNEQLKSFDSVNTKIKVSNEKTKKSK